MSSQNGTNSTLARLLVATAASDTSVPPTWRTNELLGSLEKLLVHTDGRPLDFAEVCKEALNAVEDTGNRAIIRLGIINGLRRSDDADVPAVQRLFTDVRTEINALPPGPRKDRCLSFWRYQARVFLARNGFYAEAAIAEAEESALAVSPEGRAISAYLVRVYSMWDALVEGDTNKIVRQVALLEQALPALQLGVTGTGAEVQWGKGNGPVHLLQALFLARLPIEGHLFEGFIASGDQLDEKAFGPWTVALKAAERFSNNDQGAAKYLAEKIVSDNFSPSVTAAARLILARIAVKAGELDEARSLYGLIQPVSDGHMIAAVAIQEFVEVDG